MHSSPSRSLHDTPSDPKFIQTVPRRGYRFVAEVKELAELKEVWRSALVETPWVPFAVCSILLIGIWSGVTISRRPRGMSQYWFFLLTIQASKRAVPTTRTLPRPN